MHWPVTYDADSLARNRIGPTISSGRPGLPAGICRLNVDRAKELEKKPCVISVSKRPGHSAFTVMPAEAYVEDIPLVKPHTPAFEAL